MRTHRGQDARCSEESLRHGPGGRAGGSLRSFSPLPPTRLRVSPVTTLLRTSRSPLSCSASVDHPHVAAASLPRPTPAHLGTPACCHPGGRHPPPAAQPTSSARSGGGDTGTGCQKPRFLRDKAHPRPSTSPLTLQRSFELNQLFKWRGGGRVTSSMFSVIRQKKEKLRQRWPAARLKAPHHVFLPGAT